MRRFSRDVWVDARYKPPSDVWVLYTCALPLMCVCGDTYPLEVLVLGVRLASARAPNIPSAVGGLVAQGVMP